MRTGKAAMLDCSHWAIAGRWLKSSRQSGFSDVLRVCVIRQGRAKVLTKSKHLICGNSGEEALIKAAN